MGGLDRPLQLAVFVSGRGSNLQSLIDAFSAKDFPAEIALVISNNPAAYALERAAKAGIRTAIVNHKDHASRPEFEAALQAELAKQPIDLICLAGFMRILSPGFVSDWMDRIINIHPSLLPKYKGLDTHARAIAGGETMSGCSVHYVTAEMDEGEIIVQKSLEILKTDTADTLAARILQLEHEAYPEAVLIVAEKLNSGAKIGD